MTSGRKRYCVSTQRKPRWWLRALDPLLPGRASEVRSTWIPVQSDATLFDSNMYASEVAGRSPKKNHEGESMRPFKVEPL